MEALVATAILVGLMVLALRLLSATWPRTFRPGGYRARLRDTGQPDPSPGAGPPVPEDDDARWRWPRPGERRDPGR